LFHISFQVFNFFFKIILIFLYFILFSFSQPSKIFALSFILLHSISIPFPPINSRIYSLFPLFSLITLSSIIFLTYSQYPIPHTTIKLDFLTNIYFLFSNFHSTLPSNFIINYSKYLFFPLSPKYSSQLKQYYSYPKTIFSFFHNTITFSLPLLNSHHYPSNQYYPINNSIAIKNSNKISLILKKVKLNSPNSN
jgi:hypothetical protein